jgi:hypothetical protein
MVALVTDSRFKPASWCEVRDEFGKKEVIAWRTESATTLDAADQLRVAQIHHDLVVRVWRALRARGWRVEDYAEEVGYSLDRMGKLMRGEAILRLEDVAATERLFDVTFLPATKQV